MLVLLMTRAVLGIAQRSSMLWMQSFSTREQLRSPIRQREADINGEMRWIDG